jgi:uncharacterized protein YycO
MVRSYVRVDRDAVERFGPDEDAPSPRPGDFILTHGSAWTSKLISFGEGLRYWGADRKYTRWNHAALILNADGDLVEALGKGVSRGNLSKYKPTEYYLVRITASEEDRQHVVDFGEASAGDPYGWLTIVSIGLTLVTGAKFNFNVDGQQICSGLVARAEERTGVIFADASDEGPKALREPSHIMPADLAMYYDVEPPPPGTPKGKVPK